MSEIPYTPLTGKIKEYFAKIQEIGVPSDKVNVKWLRSVGFKSGNDNYLISILKFIGFVDSVGTPTEYWRKYKDTTKAKAVLAEAIRTGYKKLFETYGDAQRKDREALYAFFASETGKAKGTVDKMVTTFIGLCELADFEAEVPMTRKETIPTAVTGRSSHVMKEVVTPEIHINIQLHLPATNDSAVYDSLFKSLRKNLLSENE